MLGDLLGEVLRESGGQELLDDVERLRHAVIAARSVQLTVPGAALAGGGDGTGLAGGGDGGRAGGGDGPGLAGDEIAALVASWPLERAELVARAFTIYFHLVNLAEERQRVRTLRGSGSAARPRRESLAAAVAELSREQGPQRLAELVAGLRVHPVLTAHPTEARRRAVVTALRRISALLEALDQVRGTPQQAETERRLREEIDLLWLTAPLRDRAMGPIDEVRSVMAVFDETLFTLAPVVYRHLEAACRDLPGAGGTGEVRVPAFLRFGSWVGADRDGNPYVTAQVTRETAAIQAEHALLALENAATRVGRALTVHADAAPPVPSFTLALEAAQLAHPELLADLHARSPREPYRAYLLYAAARLRATRLRHADLAYRGCEDFLADLRLVQESLAGAGARRQAAGELQHLIWQAETFGFHGAELEVRQHSAVHSRALREIAGGETVSDETEEVLA
ncbi:MAG: phosphoenolpyruvate carboxylase, partial [Actinobacteria bacterium]|nr:phosphoenolpyruvate carboxylase [Actinomycetota bacterium]